MIVSEHAIQRVRERVSPEHDAHQLLHWLWKQGRKARRKDFAFFSTIRQPGRMYRVAARPMPTFVMHFLVVRDRTTGVYITLIKRTVNHDSR